MSHKAETWSKWRGLVTEHRDSGKSVAAFCRERGLPVSQMFAWKRRLRDSSVADRSSSVGCEPGAPQFVALEVVPPIEAQCPLSVRPGRAIEVRLEHGRSLMVEPGFDASHLRALLAVLEAEA
jgi:transposase-like protein